MTLSELRKQNKLTQEQVAEQLNVSVTTISNWENNVAHPTYQNLSKLSKIYGVPVSSLSQSLSEEIDYQKNGTNPFPDYYFTDSDVDYLLKLKFSVGETEFIRMIATYCTFGNDGVINFDYLQEYKFEHLKCLPDFYVSKFDDISELNKISFLVWQKLVSNKNSVQQGIFPYKVIWDSIIDFLFKNDVGQNVVAFDITDLSDFDLQSLANNMATWRHSKDNNYFHPSLQEIEMAISLVDCDVFNLKNYLEYFHCKYPDKFGSNEENMKSYFCYSDIADWFLWDGNFDESSRFYLTDKGKAFLKTLKGYHRYYNDTIKKDDSVVLKENNNDDIIYFVLDVIHNGVDVVCMQQSEGKNEKLEKCVFPVCDVVCVFDNKTEEHLIENFKEWEKFQQKLDDRKKADLIKEIENIGE